MYKYASKGNAMNEEESAVADFLQILEDHRQNCEEQGKYVEAEIATKRLEELKTHEDKRKREAIHSRQLSEKLGLEEAHMLEFQQFNTIWDKKMTEYEKQSEETIDTMKQRHYYELLDFQKKMLAKLHHPKFSTELLNQRKIQEHLAKSKNYNGAHKMKVKADKLEAIELEKWQTQKELDMNQKENNFKLNKQQELAALLKRIQTGREEQRQQRQFELERLLQRYQNVKNELDVQQSIEQMKYERQAKNTSYYSDERQVAIHGNNLK